MNASLPHAFRDGRNYRKSMQIESCPRPHAYAPSAPRDSMNGLSEMENVSQIAALFYETGPPLFVA